MVHIAIKCCWAGTPPSLAVPYVHNEYGPKISTWYTQYGVWLLEVIPVIDDYGVRVCCVCRILIEYVIEVLIRFQHYYGMMAMFVSSGVRRMVIEWQLSRCRIKALPVVLGSLRRIMYVCADICEVGGGGGVRKVNVVPNPYDSDAASEKSKRYTESINTNYAIYERIWFGVSACVSVFKSRVGGYK